MSDASPRYYTRQQGVELIQAELGVPVPLSRFEKDAAIGRAPPPAARFGRRTLYTKEQILDYGRSLVAENVAA